MNNSIQHFLFEFLKRKAFLQMGVSLRTLDFQSVPIQAVQNSVYSLQLIDLYSIFDKAVDSVFLQNKFRDQKKKSRLHILNEKGLIDQNRANYLLWYRDWRNDVAHHFKTIQYYELQQASDDVQKQLFEWKLIDRIWDVRHYWEQDSPSSFKIGSRIGNIPILSYEINYVDYPNAPSKTCSYSEKINLTLEDFLKLP